MSGQTSLRDVFLLRHGALGADAQRRFIGQIDLPLSAEGQAQAQRLARWFAGYRFDAIYCSDLLRCRQTAAALVPLCPTPPRQRSAWREIALGSWEGRERARVAEEEPERYAARGNDLMHVAPPGGESFADCLRRLLPAWEEIASGPERRVALVAHAGVNRLLLTQLLGLSQTQWMQIAQHYGCVNWLRCEQGQWRALTLDLCPHEAEVAPCQPVTK